jgi:hypothetical protein
MQKAAATVHVSGSQENSFWVEAVRKEASISSSETGYGVYSV